MKETDMIEIRRLKVATRIGVPDEERAVPQDVLVTILMTPAEDFSDLGDEISRTVNYYEVSLEIAKLAAARPRRLIETLATDIAAWLLDRHPLRRVRVSIEKHILPNTECVAVHIDRERQEA